MDKIYIILQNGMVFEGKSFGKRGETVGELVFTTGMCGYIETLTDPSYYGQIVVQTFPMIGNYGIIDEDKESEKPALKAYVVNEWAEFPSNFRCGENVDEFLKDNNIIGVCGIDTRLLTKVVRESGVMNAKISYSDEYTDDIASYSIKDAVDSVSKKDEVYGDKNAEFKVALIDYGAKANIVRELVKKGCFVKSFNHTVTSKEILNGGFDGLMLSNGPGDPSENISEIKVISELLEQIPIFGICLGHQLLALANGSVTEKLRYGHRGTNQPVKNILKNRVYITSQNHGYAVKNETVKGVLTFVNANDNTCEGIAYPDKKAFSVQFHPEACSGPKDTAYLFDEFICLMKNQRG